MVWRYPSGIGGKKFDEPEVDRAWEETLFEVGPA